MNIKQHVPFLPFIGAITMIALGLHYATTHDIFNHSFRIERAHKRTLVALINAQGRLVPQSIIKVGNLVNGIMRALYVTENALIEPGQLLAEIDDGREDTDVNTSFGNLDAAQAVLSYQLELLKRQQELFKYKQVSLDGLQQAERDYEAAYAKVEQAKGAYELAKLTYDNKQVRSPVYGMILQKSISIGETVTNFPPASVIYSIAANIETLNAHIIIENDVLELLQPNTPATMTVDAFPHKKLSGVITDVIEMPYNMNATDNPYARLIPKNANLPCLCAVVPLDNSDLALRPNMTIKAQITAAEKDNVMSISRTAFAVTNQAIEQLATQLKYAYHPLDDKQLLAVASNIAAKPIWIYHNKTFTQKIVITGIKDADFVEIVDGLDGSEDIVISTDYQMSRK